MWTHLQPYLPNDRRASTISRKARIGLWRAINLRRLILLVGSGATISLGQKSWNGVIIEFIALTVDQFAKKINKDDSEDGVPAINRAPGRQIRLFDQIMELCGTEEECKFYGLDGDGATRTAICEALLEKEARGDLDQNALRTALDLCEELLRVMDEDEAEPHHFSDVRKEFAKLFHSTAEDIVELEQGDPIEQIINHTKSRRILTTNYDAEFERFLFKHWLSSEPKTHAHKAFESLPYHTKENVTETERQRKISVSSPLRPSISSTSINTENVGDLVNFASYSRTEQYQVFHLHGRLDRPLEMVVSKNDYRRVYAQDPSSAEAFQAAQEILFSGNDVLMVGFGGESEILVPFRRFVERGRRADQAPRRTFALLPSETGEDYKRLNATKAIDWALDYDIYTIHYGGHRFRQTLGALKSLKTKLNHAWKTRREETTIPLVKDALETIDEFRIRRPPDVELDSRGRKELVSDRSFDELTRLAAIEKSSRLKGKAREAWLIEVRKIRDIAEIETRTNGMLYELDELGRLSRDWWDAMRHAPHERRARYHIADRRISGELGYLSVRHCSIWEPRLLLTKPTDWPQLVHAREMAQSEEVQRPGHARRIIRFTAPRGTGQATFSNLLHRKENQEFVFNLPAEASYKGAFLAHLSFSMEFTSVLKAFSRFFSYWIAKCLAEHADVEPDDALLASERRELLDRFTKQYEEARSYFMPRSGQAIGSLEEFERLRRLTKFLRLDAVLKAKINNAMRDPLAYAALNLTAAELTQAAQELVAVAWEDDQDLMGRTTLGLAAQSAKASMEDGVSGEHRAQRRHRLDMLREAMVKYTAVSFGRRLFVCLSGLDRIADEHGDAYNPAHRAFFRLLCEREERTETDPLTHIGLKKLPIDIVLIAGKPQSPIAYLSNEFEPGKDKEEIVAEIYDRDGEPRPLSGNVQNYSNRSATKRLLKRWTELKTLSWERRIAMLNIEIEDEHFNYAENLEAEYQRDPRTEDREPDQLPSAQHAAAVFLRWAQATQSDLSHRDLSELHETSQIHRLLYQNLSLSLWVMRLWIHQAKEKEQTGHSPVPYGFHSFLRDLDAAAARDGHHGVLRYVIDSYERVDALSQGNNRKKAESSYVPELHALIMRHLVLFALPVEPWVLIGCPMILRLLQTEFRRRCDEHGGLPVLSRDERKEEFRRQAYLARTEWLERVFILRELHKALNTLVRRAVVMRVQPATDDFEREDWDRNDEKVTEAFIHTRYSIHNRIRQFIAHTIHLGVHDGADINHHRMSIYCDQPRELPSPTQEHFELVRDILEYQIDLSRDTLWAMFHIGHEQARIKDIMEGWDTETAPSSGKEDSAPSQEDRDINDAPDDRRSQHAAARRIFSPDLTCEGRMSEINADLDRIATKLGIEDWAAPDGLGGGLGRLHAVPQRLRAMFSVLQGSFAIGSLSRMTSVRSSLSEDVETPYDAYGSWLRSLINAGASLDRTQLEFQRLFCGTTFQDRADERTNLSAWIDQAPGGSANQQSIERIKTAEESIRRAANELELGPVQKTRHSTLRHPFYRDEIAWLYNERGLSSLTQGNVFDALPLLRQASFIMSHRRVPESDSHAFHAAERRIHLNYAIALLERGSVSEARRVLTDLRIGSLQIKGSTPSEIKPFSELYLAVCDHIGGSFHRAEECYEELNKTFSEKNQFRAVAITCRSHADLCRVRGDWKRGLELADLAIKASSRSEQRDIEHLSMVSCARLHIAEGNSHKATPLLERALAYARHMGLPRIEIDAKIAMSALMNQQGDYTLAGQFASEAASRSVETGLRLRKLSALFSYAISRRERGSEDFCKRLLLKIGAESEALGYMTLAGAVNTEMPV